LRNAAVHALRRAYVTSRVRELLPHRLVVALRGVWVAIARRAGYPISSPRFPRPTLGTDHKPFHLERVLLACDLNPDYLEFWPSTRQAWKEIVGLEVTLVLVAEAHGIPAELQGDPDVILFEPLAGVHTAFQAQCLRLLYPATMTAEGAVIISDLDLYPLRPAYFHRPVELLDERFFVVYRDARVAREEFDMLFNAALPSTWRDVFGVATVEDVRAELSRWADGLVYDGRRGWEGWYTDQRTLYRKLLSWPARAARLWVLDDQYCGFRRLDRMELENEEGLEPQRIRGIQQGEYSDFNCFVPYREHREINDRVLALALDARNGPTDPLTT
jgi:hypothetical protein